MQQRPTPLRTFILLFLPLVGILAVKGPAYFGPPIFEVGDFAANGLQIENAKHLSELLGNYSRFGFHHPGPAFFYVYALGDLLFRDLLHLVQSPANAYLLTGLLLQLAFLASALAILASIVPAHRTTFLLVSLAIGVAFVGLTESPEFEVWPPYQVVIPFACFLSAAIALALGWAALLPIVTLCAAFLVHGHVAQPLFVVPIFVLAYGSLFAVSRERPGLGWMRFVRATARPHLWAVTVVSPFLFTLMLDGMRGTQSNLTSIFAFMAQPNPTPPTWDRALYYVLNFLAFRGTQHVNGLDVAAAEQGTFLAAYWPAFLGWLVVVIAPAVVILRSGEGGERPIAVVNASPISGRRFVATYYGLSGVTTLLSFVWVVNQRDELFAFNSFFINGLLFVAVLPVAFVLARTDFLPSRPMRFGFGLAIVFVALMLSSRFTDLQTLGGEPGDPTGRELNDAAARLATEPGRSSSPILLRFSPEDWSTVVGLALSLERHRITYLVPPEWGFMFGYDH